jgi:predicted branched-subunit amino acid permease
VFAYQLTDETFAIHSTYFSAGGSIKAEVFATNMTAQTSWVFGTWLGAVAGHRISDVRPLALDYALPALFIALLALQIKDRLHIVVAILTGALAVGLLYIGMEQWNIIVAAVIGATTGVILEQWTKMPSS